MACAASAAERRRNVDLKTIRNLPPQHSTLHSKGLDARELPLSAAEGEVFSLDIPFYRTRFPPRPSGGPLPRGIRARGLLTGLIQFHTA